MTFPILLDLIVVSLLVATIIYAVMLNKRLTTLHENRHELQKFLENFTTSLNKAEASVKDLKGAGESALNSVLQQLTKATTLRDELAFLLERGEDVAEKLDEAIRQGRALKGDVENMPELRAVPSNESKAKSSEEKIVPQLLKVR